MKINRKGFPHEIIESPTKLEVNKRLSDDEYLCYFPHPEVFKEENLPIKLKINEKENKLIINSTADYVSRIFLLLIGVFITYPLFSTTGWDSIGDILINIFLISASARMFVDAIIAPKRIFIFDRMTGILTYPDLFGYKQSIPFSKAVFRRNGTGSPPVQSGNLPGYFLAIIHKNKITSASLFLTDIHTIDRCWSFLVWYMDRNRPLPPGNAFTEQHRRQNYERRKAEGFPRPLYPSRTLIREDYSNIPPQIRRKRKGGRK